MTAKPSKPAAIVVVTVPGMACRHDVRRISASIADVAGVQAFQVDLATKTVTVEGSASADAVGTAIAAAGYNISGPSV